MFHDAISSSVLENPLSNLSNLEYMRVLGHAFSVYITNVFVKVNIHMKRKNRRYIDILIFEYSDW